jgi:mannan endo-1,4-beta-mannosidase
MPSMKKMHYYAPFKGQLSEPDFIKFYQNKKILFEKTLGKKKLYYTN